MQGRPTDNRSTNTTRNNRLATVLTVASFYFFAASAGPWVSSVNAQSAQPRQNTGATQIANANTAMTPPAAQAPKVTPASKSMANAHPSQAKPGAKKKAPAAARRKGPIRNYFVEFRSRLAESYGHAYLVYGRADENGLIVQSAVAGLHPFGESVLPWLIGHIIPVPSETGASDGDLEEIYISARYRVLLSEADYRKTVAYIKDKQVSNPLWHAGLNNCVGFLKDVAQFMGLQTPITSWLYPELFVTRLREMNESPDHMATTLFPHKQWGMQ